MSATNNFFFWFYYGLNNLGGWFIFFLAALAAVIWLFYDSTKRRLPAVEWRLGISVAAALILPAILYRFTVTDIADSVTSPLGPFSEPIFYLGLLGGILPIVLAVGYYVTFQGLAACPDGHVYEAVMGNCPHPDHLPPPPPTSPQLRFSEPHIQGSRDETPPPVRNKKKRLNAWLVTTDERRTYQLYVDETRIGRSMKNDIVLESDRTVSRESARIVEQKGRFRLIPLNPGRFPRINNYVIREAVLLEPDDEIQFGEHTVLRFVTSR
jgi:hypothetical protein